MLLWSWPHNMLYTTWEEGQTERQNYPSLALQIVASREGLVHVARTPQDFAHRVQTSTEVSVFWENIISGKYLSGKIAR